ncbi:MAG: hypothetical protein ACLPQS_01930 [Acidimicrobiales bacterium]
MPSHARHTRLASHAGHTSRATGDANAGRHRRAVVAGLIGTAAIGAAAIGAAFAIPLAAGAEHIKPGISKSSATVQERKVGKYGEILVNSTGFSLYVLSTESKGKLHCTSKECLANWPPLLVDKNAKITVEAGVKGKIGHVVRGSKWQVTFNGWPAYRFIADTKAGQTNGEGIVAFGGTWYLVHAGSSTNSGTPITNTTKAGGGTTTTTTSAGTTTTTTGGGTTTTTAPW